MKLATTLCLTVLGLSVSAWPQAVTYPLIVTVAGNGQATFAGDGGAALQAALRNPYAVAVDRAGNLYIADTDNHRVRKVGPDGLITTVAGTGVRGFGGDRGPAASAQLADPIGLAVDAAGNLYIADSSNHRIRKVSAAGEITTAVGTGVSGFSGDQGPAVSAQLADPLTVAVDAAGNLYIADYGNDRVRKVTAGGTITTAAQLTTPYGVAVDAAGNLFISEYEGHRVRRVGTDNVIRTVAGTGVAGFSGDGGPATAAALQYPGGLATDSAGALYVADRGNDCVRKLSPAGVITTVAGRAWSGFSGDGGPATLARLATPSDVAVDAAGDLYVADTDNQRVRRVIISPTVGPLTITTASPLAGGTAGSAYSTTLAAAGGTAPYQWLLVSGALPPGLVLDASSGALSGTPARAGSFSFALQVTDRAGVSVTKWLTAAIGWRAASGAISTVAGDGTAGFAGDNAPATAARLNRPVALALDGEGNLSIADQLNQRIRKVSRAGIISTYAGTGQQGFAGDRGAALSAQLYKPEGLATDAQGSLYVADAGNHRVRKIDRAGVITTVVGTGTPGFGGDGGPAAAAQLNWPVGLTFDAAGNLYLGDWLNARVRKVTPAGIITSVAGTGSPGFSGDGGVATAAQLYGPGGLATDASGNLYIPDYFNHRVRVVNPAGVINTAAGNGSLSFSGDGGAPASAALAYPCGVAVDAAGNLFIADRDNHRVRKVSTAGIFTVAGTGSPGFGGDGGPATSAHLDSPMDVALDSEGNLYIAEAGGNRIRKVALAQGREPLAIATPAPLPPAALGSPYLVILFPTGGTPPYNWSLGAATLPAGLSFEAATGTLGGVPTAAGAFSFEIRLADADGAAVSKSFTLTVASGEPPGPPPAAPQITAAGIVHAASARSGPVAPGEIVTIYGANLGPPVGVSSQPDESGNLPTALAEVQVLFDDTPAPMLYAQQQQLSLIVPYTVARSLQTQVRVRYRGAASNLVQTPVAPSNPGIFTADMTGRGQGAVLNQDNSVNAAANPAERGSIVQIFGTGEGETEPEVPAGQVARPEALPKPKLPVAVKIGGLDADVLYAGASPGLVVGLLQVNARVPQGVAPGGAVPVVLAVGTASSPAGVTLAVR